MTVHIPSQLHSYTGRESEVDAHGATLAELLWDLDRRYPGLRFRIIDEQDHIREHINIFINEERTRQRDAPLRPTDVVHIMGALSGG